MTVSSTVPGNRSRNSVVTARFVPVDVPRSSRIIRRRKRAY